MPLRTTLTSAAAIIALALSSCGGSDKSSSATTAAAPAPAESTLPGAQTGPPPWDAGGNQLAARLDAIGLPALPAEGTVVHIHQHLDLFVGGRQVVVPAGIGIDPNQQFISPLHTHDPSGVMHVESVTRETFTLGQFFDVWGVPLDSTRMGGLKAGGGEQLRTWVNGKPSSGNPAKVVLASHQEIVLAYGTAAQMPKPVPARYPFPPGN